jgi:L-ascorbate metabolism protein UlaG (beta-lactamase superfamily)
MQEKTAYTLADSTVAEPLVNKWVAWAHVLPPVPGSLHLLHYQMRILKSYLEDPQVHVRTCQNPKLRSGPFVDIPAERAGEVSDFLSATETRMSRNIELARATIEFQNYLVREAHGLSLDQYYGKLPEALRGYVELVYDYHHRPSVKFFEGMLYKSDYYDKHLQSFRLFRQRRDNDRSFIMSTPRLPEAGLIDWELPFESPEVDEFFKLQVKPQPLGYIRELLGLRPADEELLRPLLSTEPVARAPESWHGAEPRIRYFGHACALIEWNGVSILTDPYIGVVPAEGGIARNSYKDLPEHIDYVLITHYHQDHFSLETLLRLRHKIGCLVVPRSTGFFYGDLSLKLLSQTVGFKNVVELETMEAIPLPDGEIVAVPFMGEHADLPHGKSAYVVRTGRQQTLFAADSDCLDVRMYEHLRRSLGPIETVFIGTECVGAPLSWSCGPFFPVKPDFTLEKSRRYKGSDSHRAQQILEAVGARRLYIYAMGLEPWFEHMLGLAYSDDATQIKESTNLLKLAEEAGFETAERLFGKREMLLPAEAHDAHTPHLEESPTLQPVADNEDEFVFD